MFSSVARHAQSSCDLTVFVDFVCMFIQLCFFTALSHDVDRHIFKKREKREKKKEGSYNVVPLAAQTAVRRAAGERAKIVFF